MFGSTRALDIFCAVALAGGLVACGPRPQQPTAEATNLAEAPGRAAVEAACTSCHDARVIVRSSGYTRAHWDELIAAMVALPAEQEGEILDYLAQHYPPSHNPRPATVVEGPLQISFREWTAEQLGQRPRDPVEAPDGTIWYVGQHGNTIGRIDPRTNEVREWPLPEGALPHSVNVDAEGGVWATATARSASSIPRLGKRANIACPTRMRATRTPRSSTATASCGSRCSRAT